MQFFKSQVLVLSLVCSLAATAQAIQLESLHVVRKIEALALRVDANENTTKQNTCFKVDGDTLSFYLKDCSEVSSRDSVTQSWKLSAPVPSAIKDYISPVEAQFGNDPSLSEKFAKMKSYIPNDSVGRLIYMPFNNKQIVVGYLNTNMNNNESPYKTAYLADLCTGPWRTLCGYNTRDNKFKWSFSFGVVGEDGYEVEYKQYKIVDFLHASVYSRGNDDFQALTYYWMKGPASSPESKAAITKDWADALRPIDKDSRISSEMLRSPIPRSEANYMTALHPVNVVVAEDDNGRRDTYLHFGAKIYYPRKAMEDTCEDDTGIYSLVDLKNVNAPLPLNPEAISHMNLGEVKKEAGIMGNYSDFLDEVPTTEDLKSTILFSDVSSTAKFPARANKWSLVIMSPKYFDDVGEARPNNPVREFLFLDKNDDGSWDSELYAYNPNDWEANNSLHPQRQLLHSPSSIRLVWDSKEPNVVKSTHPVLRAPMKTLQQIPFEKASPEERTIAKQLRTLFGDERYSGIQMNTVHGDWGIEDKYLSMLSSFRYDPTLADAVPSDSIPSFVEVTSYENQTTKYSVATIEPLVMQIFTNMESRKLEYMMKDVRQRIYDAPDTLAQITAENKFYEKASNQLYSVKDFFSNVRSFSDSEARINATLKIIWSEIPRADRKATYTETVYTDDQITERQSPLPDELKTAIFDEKAISIAERMMLIENNFDRMNNLRIPNEERKAAAEKMYEFIRIEGEKLRSWIWLLERYNSEHPRG